MTRRQLRNVVFLVIGIYSVAFLIGLVLRIFNNPILTPYYEAFKDLTPFTLAIPAAYLGYCFQQRGSYLETLRSLWSKLVSATNYSIQYTYKDNTTHEEYSELLTELSIVIDEMRGVYKNIGEGPGRTGLYPYEPIKEIRKTISDLGYGTIEHEKRADVRKKVSGYWKSIRENFLYEFDRAEPTKPTSPYLSHKPRSR